MLLLLLLLLPLLQLLHCTRQVIIIAGVTEGLVLPAWPDSHLNHLLLSKQPCPTHPLFLGAAELG